MNKRTRQMTLLHDEADGHDPASQAAVHALTQYERLRIPGRVDAAYTASVLVLQAPPKSGGN